MNKALKAAKKVLPVYRQTIDGWATGVLDGSVDSKVKASCTKGCHHCCYNMVNATLAEGAAVAAHLLEKGIFEQHRPQLEKTSKLANSVVNGDDGSFQYMASKTPCAFLKDGECSIYDLRPAACRVYFVVTPPSGCAPERAGAEVGQIDPRVPMGVFLQELLKSTHPSIPSFIGDFPSVVLAGRELIERSPGSFKRWASRSTLFNANQESETPV